MASTALLLVPRFATPSVLVAAGVANGAALYLSRTHMASFWNDRTQTRVPFVEKFNEAIRGSEQVVVRPT